MGGQVDFFYQQNIEARVAERSSLCIWDPCLCTKWDIRFLSVIIPLSVVTTLNKDPDGCLMHPVQFSGIVGGLWPSSYRLGFQCILRMASSWFTTNSSTRGIPGLVWSRWILFGFGGSYHQSSWLKPKGYDTIMWRLSVRVSDSDFSSRSQGSINWT